MEVKTNKEYQAMQHEIAVAEHEVRAHEDKLLEHMEEAETSPPSEGGGGGAEGGAGEVDARQKPLEAERGDARAGARAGSTAERAALVAELVPQALALFEPSRSGRKGVAVAEARDGLCTRLPRPAAAAGVQRGPPQRRAHPVRQLHAHPLFRPAPPRRRRGPACS